MKFPLHKSTASSKVVSLTWLRGLYFVVVQGRGKPQKTIKLELTLFFANPILPGPRGAHLPRKSRRKNMKRIIRFFLAGILLSSALIGANAVFAQDDDDYYYEEIRIDTEAPQYKYYSDQNHWNIFINPIVTKQKDDYAKYDAMGIQYAYYTIGRYLAAIPKESEYKKPAPIYDYSTTTYKLPIDGKDRAKMAAIRKVIFPFSNQFADNISTDSIVNSYVIENIIQLDDIFKGDFIISGLDWREHATVYDYHYYGDNPKNEKEPDFTKLNPNSIIKQYQSNIYVLRPNTFTSMPIEYNGRQTWGKEMFEATPVAATVFDANLFCLNTPTGQKPYLIQNGHLIALNPKNQLKKPNDELSRIYPRGIMVNETLTSDKNKVLSFLKEDSYLYKYYNDRTDIYPSITIEGEPCIWQQDDYLSIDELYEDYWNGDNCNLDYLGEVFSRCAKLEPYGNLTSELNNLILEVNNLRSKAETLSYYSNNSESEELLKKADELEIRFYKLIQQELKSQGVEIRNDYSRKNSTPGYYYND